VQAYVFVSLLCVSQVFFVQRGDRPKSQGDHHTEHSRLTERLARAFCLALCPHLKLLKEDGMAKLGLRVTLDSQQVRVPIE
jgi:MAD (mothers against decapentaplegic) interacting protein